MNRIRSSALLLFFLALTALPASAGEILRLRIEGVINPIKVRYVANAFEEAKTKEASLIIISINTPGGLVESMQRIVELIVNSPVPVVTYVEPQAAMATSAGAFIVFAGDVAAMTPGSTIGSAHPVGGQGEEIKGPMEDKVVNLLVSLSKSLAKRRGRNLTFAEQSIRSSMNLSAEEALETGAIDMLAKDIPELLKKLDGFYIDNENRKDTITITGLPLRDIPLSRFENFLDAVANPTIAYILMTLGVMGLIYEFSNPGIGLGAVVGSICLLLGLIALSALPIHLGGILLLCLGVIMIILELKVPSHGLLSVGGVIAITLGTFVFVDAGEYFGAVQTLKFHVVLPILAAAIALVVLVLGLGIKALSSPQKVGADALVGMTGVVKKALAPSGMVFVDGALWEAESSEGEILENEKIIVKEVLETPTRFLVERVGSKK